MTALSCKLAESKSRKRISEKSPITAIDARSPYELFRLGFVDSIEGLLAIPTPDVATLDIDRIREEFRTNGDWFPFEVAVDDLVFVLDDDGSLYISTENFPLSTRGAGQSGIGPSQARAYTVFVIADCAVAALNWAVHEGLARELASARWRRSRAPGRTGRRSFASWP